MFFLTSFWGNITCGLLPEDAFIQTVTRVHEKISKTSTKKRRGWYTKEGMEKILKWSKPRTCKLH